MVYPQSCIEQIESAIEFLAENQHHFVAFCPAL